MVRRSIALALTLAALVACAAVTSMRSTRTSACRWSEARPLMVGADGLVHVETPQVVATAGGLAFLGDNTLILAARDSVFERLGGWPRGPGMLGGVIRRPGGRFEAVPLPYHLRAYVSVRAVSDDAGTAHVFWGGSSDTTSDQHRHVTSIWYARYDGRAWSEPEQVYADTALRWNTTFTTIAASGGDVHVMAPAGSLERGYLVHVWRQPDGRWIVRRLPFAAMYVSLAAERGGTLHLGYIHPAGASRTAVSVVRSTDRGRTWSEPIELHRSGTSGNWGLQVVATGPRTVYALWEASRPMPAPSGMDDIRMTSELHDSVQAMVSSDAGFTWRRLPGLHVPGGAEGLQATGGPDAAVHAAFKTGWGDSAVLNAARLAAEGWGPAVAVGPGPFRPTIAGHRDTLYVTWDDWRSAGSWRVPLTLHATYTCADRPGVR